MKTAQRDQLLMILNNAWPNAYEACYHERIQYAEMDTVEGLSLVPFRDVKGHIHITPINPRNKQFTKRVIATFEEDHIAVTVLIDHGEVKSAGEDIFRPFCTYAAERFADIKENAVYLNKVSKVGLLNWTPNVIGNCAEVEYSNIGTTKLEYSDDLDEIATNLAHGFNLMEHPNCYDFYLEMNNKKYVNDSWTKPE